MPARKVAITVFIVIYLCVSDPSGVKLALASCKLL